MHRILFILLLAGLGFSPDLEARLQFTEIIALNNNGVVNPLTGSPGDWIEIHNSGSASMDLSHYYLSDRFDAPFMWRFPENTSIPANGYLLVWTDGTGDTISGLHASFKLDVAGESLVLFSAKREFIDFITFPRMYEDISYGVSADGGNMFFRKPTPGASNLNAGEFLVSGDVVISPPAGIYSTGVSISMGAGGKAGAVRYTLDGSEPGPTDPEFRGGVIITQSTVVRARLWTEGAEPGEIATASYIIHEDFDLPVISLATEPDGLWSDQNGIYVTGTNGVTGNCSEIPRNWNQDWERPVSMEYFDVDGQLGLQIDAGMKIHGGCSRGFPMKSLGIFARSEYGQSIMNYPFFREKGLDEFKGLILRNGGNDFQYTLIRDVVIQATVHPVMDLDYQAYEPVHVYLNGEYWGIHNLREKVNEHWVTSNYGIPADNLDFIKNEWEVFAGTRDAWDDLTRYLENNHLVLGAPYSVVESQLDINSYQDYLITQLFIANRDWPGNNQKYWRDHVTQSKWRFILFDLEFSFGIYEFNPALDMFTFATNAIGNDWPNPAWATLMIRRLFENQGFREQFLAKYMMHLNTTFAPERVIGIIDSIQNHIYNAFPEHLARWRYQSMAGWESRVEELRQFARVRPDYVWNNMRRFFSLGEIVTMHVEPTGATGHINANTVNIPAEGFTGKYTAGSKLDIRFDPNPGYRFSHWEINSGTISASTLLAKGSIWRFNDSDTWPGTQWTATSYDDSSWPSGNGILGYGDGNESTLLDFGPDDQNKTTTYYFRKNFEISDISLYDSFEIGLLRDDGAVVYINGIEVIRDNMPLGAIGHDTFAAPFSGDQDETTYFIFQVEKSYFISGVNTIAVEVHQNSGTSSDLKFDLEVNVRVHGESRMNTYLDNPLILNPETDITIRAVAEVEQLELDLRINEIMADNIGAVMDEYGNNSDWIEIYNNGETIVDMAGLYLTDDLENPTKWRIPGGFPLKTSIDANGYLVFYADENPMLGPRHLDFKLSSIGESVGISYRSGTDVVWIDSISFTRQYANVSTGYFPDGTGSWVKLDHTPGSKNVEAVVSVQPRQVLEVMLFPNPVRDQLNISISTPDGNLDQVDLYILDLTGRRILSEQKSAWGGVLEDRIDVSALPGAMYILVIETTSGTHSFRFVKTER